MADYRARQRVQIHDGTDEFGVTSGKPIFVSIADGGNSITVDASNLDIRDLVAGTDAGEDNILIFANTVKDGSGTNYVPLVDADGHLQIDVLSGATGGTEYAEDTQAGDGDMGRLVLVVRNDTLASLVTTDGDYSALQVDADGALYTTIRDGGNSITIDNSTLSVTGGGTEASALRVTIATDSTGVLSVDDNGSSLTVDGTVTVSSITNAVTIQDGGNSITVDGSVSVTASDLDIRNLTLADDAVKISGNSSANSETNPIFVQNVETKVSGSEIHNFDSEVIAKDGTDNHDYTVTGTTFFLKSVIVAASGAGKYEIQAGPVASLVTKAVAFTSGAKPTEQLFFEPPIEVPVTSTGTVRVIRRNDDNASMTMYSTIIGNDVP